MRQLSSTVVRRAHVTREHERDFGIQVLVVAEALLDARHDLGRAIERAALDRDHRLEEIEPRIHVGLAAVLRARLQRGLGVADLARREIGDDARVPHDDRLGRSERVEVDLREHARALFGTTARVEQLGEGDREVRLLLTQPRPEALALRERGADLGAIDPHRRLDLGRVERQRRILRHRAAADHQRRGEGPGLARHISDVRNMDARFLEQLARDRLFQRFARLDK